MGGAIRCTAKLFNKLKLEFVAIKLMAMQVWWMKAYAAMS
jgi:hypothetical protein